MESKIILIIIGMSLVTMLPRILPLVVLTKVSLPPLVVNWLKHIPVAILSALLLPSLLLSKGTLSLTLDNKYILASIPCMLLAAKTKNLFLTVIVGIGMMALLQL